MRLGRNSRRGHFLQVVIAQGSRASAFHLLKIIQAFNVPHKEQAFQRLNVRTCGNHVHCNRYSGIVKIAEICQHRFWVFFGFIGHFLAKGIAFPKLFPHYIDYVIGMTVVLGKNQGFRDFLSAGKDLWPLLLKRPYHVSYLAGIDHVPVQLFSRIGEILVKLFPAFLPCKLLPPVHKLLRTYFCPVFGDFGLNSVHIETHIHAICHCFFVAVFTHYIFIEKAEGAFIRCGCQTY